MIFPVELPLACAAFGTPRFQTVLKSELEGLATHRLPLQQGLVHGSVVLDMPFKVMIIAVEALDGHARIKFGVFYNSIVAGCNCADDPTPVEALSEYCEMVATLDLRSGIAEIGLTE